MTELVHCNSCGSDSYPSLNLRGDMIPKLVPCCPNCGIEHVSTSYESVVEVKSTSVGEHRVSTPVADPVDAIKARLGFLDVELGRLDGYKKERTRLRRMLKAAGDST